MLPFRLCLCFSHDLPPSNNEHTNRFHFRYTNLPCDLLLSRCIMSAARYIPVLTDASRCEEQHPHSRIPVRSTSGALFFRLTELSSNVHTVKAPSSTKWASSPTTVDKHGICCRMFHYKFSVLLYKLSGFRYHSIIVGPISIEHWSTLTP